MYPTMHSASAKGANERAGKQPLSIVSRKVPPPRKVFWRTRETSHLSARRARDRTGNKTSTLAKRAHGVLRPKMRRSIRAAGILITCSTNKQAPTTSLGSSAVQAGSEINCRRRAWCRRSTRTSFFSLRLNEAMFACSQTNGGLPLRGQLFAQCALYDERALQRAAPLNKHKHRRQNDPG